MLLGLIAGCRVFVINQRPEIGTIQIDVVIYPEDSCWIAQGLQLDIAAKGRTPIEAADNFTKAVGAELIMSLELGTQLLLQELDQHQRNFGSFLSTPK